MRYFLTAPGLGNTSPRTVRLRWLKCVLFWGHRWVDFSIPGMGDQGKGECCKHCHIIKIEPASRSMK